MGRVFNIQKGLLPAMKSPIVCIYSLFIWDTSGYFALSTNLFLRRFVLLLRHKQTKRNKRNVLGTTWIELFFFEKYPLSRVQKCSTGARRNKWDTLHTYIYSSLDNCCAVQLKLINYKSCSFNITCSSTTNQNIRLYCDRLHHGRELV